MSSTRLSELYEAEMRILRNIDWIRKGPLYLPAHMKERLSLRAQIEGVSESSKARKKLLMLAGASLAAASRLRAHVSETRYGQGKTEAENSKLAVQSTIRHTGAWQRTFKDGWTTSEACASCRLS